MTPANKNFMLEYFCSIQNFKKEKFLPQHLPQQKVLIFLIRIKIYRAKSKIKETFF